MKDFVLDRSSVAIGSIDDEPDDLAYWLRQSPETRIAGIEFLRRQFFSYGEARPEFCRFLEDLADIDALTRSADQARP